MKPWRTSRRRRSSGSASCGAGRHNPLPFSERKTSAPPEVGALVTRRDTDSLELVLSRALLPAFRSLLLALRFWPLIPRSAQSLARRLAGQFSAVDDQNAVDRHIGNAGAVLIWLLERREIAHRRGVKGDEISGKPGLDETSIL